MTLLVLKEFNWAYTQTNYFRRIKFLANFNHMDTVWYFYTNQNYFMRLRFDI